MQTSKMVESHIVEAKNSTPVKMHYIELSPKRKSKRELHPDDGSRRIMTQDSRSIIDSHNTYKENNPVNFEIVNMPIRMEKPFQKIPTFKNEQVIVRTKAVSALEHSESKSKRKKITVTKLFSQQPRSQVQPSVFTPNSPPQAIASEEF